MSTSYSKYIKEEGKKFFPAGDVHIVDKVESGWYELESSRERGIYLSKKDIHNDEILLLPIKAQNEILKDIDNFWSKEEIFEEFKFVFKRGILLYGPPGSGKTSIIHLLAKNLTEKQKGVIIEISTQDDLLLYSKFMKTAFRVIEPDTPILTFIEDIDGLCYNKYTESLLINILDGVNQIRKVAYIATTNYVERLEERILNRPSRFDRKYHIGYPNLRTRRVYLEKKIPKKYLEKIDVNKWAKDTDGLTIAHLKELIVSYILGNDYEKTLKELKSFEKVISSSDSKKKKIGFGGEKTEVMYDEEEDEMTEAEGSDFTVSVHHSASIQELLENMDEQIKRERGKPGKKDDF